MKTNTLAMMAMMVALALLASCGDDAPTPSVDGSTGSGSSTTGSTPPATDDGPPAVTTTAVTTSTSSTTELDDTTQGGASTETTAGETTGGTSTGDTGSTGTGSTSDTGTGSTSDTSTGEPPMPVEVRVATYNASLNRGAFGQLITDLILGSAQAGQVAEIVQTVAPQIVLINELDYDPLGVALDLFHDQYLAVSQDGQTPLDYPYRLAFPSNTGVLAPVDLDGNGVIALPGDAYGFGTFEGQYAFALYSQHEILEDQIRCFQLFRWVDMPGALLPDDPDTPEPDDYYSPEAREVFRLSSKNHCDVPVLVEGQVLHVLISHPTPPVFDSPVIDWNGRRNHDEIRLWADYITPGQGDYLIDDAGVVGGIAVGEPFVIMGDQNADPCDGDSTGNPIQLLLGSPLVDTTLTPASLGGPEDALLDMGCNALHVCDPAYDTSDFFDGETPCVPGSASGNLRADYVLPSADTTMLDAGVFWPPIGDPQGPLVAASDHRMVWVDIELPAP